MPSPFTCYANHHFTINNKECISKNPIFFDIPSKILESSYTFKKKILVENDSFHLICKISFYWQ